MILTLFAFLFAVGLALVFLGIVRSDESVMSLAGFLILFLLSLSILQGGLEYRVGASISTNLTYNGSSIIGISQGVTDEYTAFSSSTSHTIGFFTAAASILGFVVMLASVRGRRSEDD